MFHSHRPFFSPIAVVDRAARLVVAFGLLVIATSFAGCGKSESSAARGPIDACALITVEEASEALGAPVAPPKNEVLGAGEEGKAAMSLCTYAPASGAAKSMTISVRRSPVADQTPDRVRTALAEAGATTQDVSGVGDAAFWTEGQLHVFQGKNVYMNITIMGVGSDADAMAIARSLAVRAVERLK